MQEGFNLILIVKFICINLLWLHVIQMMLITSCNTWIYLRQSSTTIHLLNFCITELLHIVSLITLRLRILNPNFLALNSLCCILAILCVRGYHSTLVLSTFNLSSSYRTVLAIVQLIDCGIETVLVVYWYLTQLFEV